MVERTVQVSEWMAEFIGWVNTKGEDEVRKLVREKLAEIKAQNEVSKDSHVDEGFKWDNALEPNDDVDQWKHGGDCNLCRKVKYCTRKCRPNRLLKKIMTPYLYRMYLTENPEAIAKNPNGLTTEELMKMAGVIQ